MSQSVLWIPRLKVLNANALSSPYTIGFPAMTAWLGAAHALQRKLNTEPDFSELNIKSTGVVCHQLELQTHKGPGDFTASIVGTANPVDKDGKRPAFIEEARCHLEVSLVLELAGVDLLTVENLCDRVSHHLNASMKMAGGDIQSFKTPVVEQLINDSDFKAFRRKLMPGHALLERRDLMVEAMGQGQDAMDALLDHLAVHHRCEPASDDKESLSGNAISDYEWTSHRRSKGWIVPIATGFHGLSDLAKAKNQRDPETPHRFAEAVLTLGEFRMPYKLESLDELQWRYHHSDNLYLCQQKQADQTLSSDQFNVNESGF